MGKRVKNQIDQKGYGGKRYLLINKVASNKKNLIKYGSVTIIALIIIGGALLNKNYNCVYNLKNLEIVNGFKDKSFDKGIQEHTKFIINTSYYTDFIELLEDKEYKVVEGSIIGGPIQLPNSIQRHVNGNIGDILSVGNTLSTHRGLDFSMSLGRKVMLLSCIREEHKDINKEVICLMNKERVIGFWEKTLKGSNKNLNSHTLLKKLKTESFDDLKNMDLKTDNFIELESLPSNYTVEMARSNGDVLYNLPENNSNNFYNFLSNVENEINHRVRIVSYVGKNEATIIDLIYDGKDIKAIIDETRKSKPNSGRNKFKVLKINKEKKKHMIFYSATLEGGNILSLMFETYIS